MEARGKSEKRELPDEPHIAGYGTIFTESDFKLANRHARYAWAFMFLLAFPIVFICMYLFGIMLGILLSPILVAPLYPLARSLFPGMGKFGSALYQKYKLKRFLLIRQYEQDRIGKSIVGHTDVTEDSKSAD